MPGRVAGEAGGETDRRHGRAAEQLGRVLERPAVVSDQRLAERCPVDRERQIVAADAAEVIGFGPENAEGAGEGIGNFGMEGLRLGSREQPGQQHVSEGTEVQDLLMI